MRVRIDVTGDKEILRDLLRIKAAGPRAVKRVLGAAAEKIARIAKPMIPDDPVTGESRLRDSLRVSRPTLQRAGRGASASVSYGTEDIPGVLHEEDLTLKHKRGGPKALARAAAQVAPEIPGDLEAALDEEVQGGS